MGEHLERAEPELLRELLRMFVQTLMSAEADAECGAEYGTRSPERTNSRNGYRAREWDTRTGTLELAIPKLRAGWRRPGRTHDEWAEGRRYLGLEVLKQSRLTLIKRFANNTESEADATPALTA